MQRTARKARFFSHLPFPAFLIPISFLSLSPDSMPNGRGWEITARVSRFVDAVHLRYDSRGDHPSQSQLLQLRKMTPYCGLPTPWKKRRREGGGVREVVDELEFLLLSLLGGLIFFLVIFHGDHRSHIVHPHSQRRRSRFADALLRKLAGVTIPSERIYGLGTGPKVEVLKKLQAMPEHQGLKLHFVEDRLITLKNVIKEPELDGWNLYLGRWGYNTEKEREEAESIPRVHLLDLSDFSSKLK